MATSAEIRQQLVAALHSDLIGPVWDDEIVVMSNSTAIGLVHNGFLVPRLPAGSRSTGDEAQRVTDLAGEDESNDAANRLRRKNATKTPTTPWIRETSAGPGSRHRWG